MRIMGGADRPHHVFRQGDKPGIFILMVGGGGEGGKEGIEEGREGERRKGGRGGRGGRVEGGREREGRRAGKEGWWISGWVDGQSSGMRFLHVGW